MVSRRENAAFLLVTGLFFLAQYLYAPFLTPYVGVLGGSLALTGLVAGSYGALQFLFRVPFGLWSDRRGHRKPFVFAGSLLAGLSALGMSWAANPWDLLLFRSLSGVAAATWVLFTVFYTSLFPPGETGRRTSLLIFAASSGQLAGNLCGGLLAERGGWTAPFRWAALPGFLAALLALTVREGAARQPEADPAKNAGVTLKRCTRRTILEPSLLALLTHFVFYATILGFTPVYVTSLGLSKLTLGLLSTGSGAAYVAGTLLAFRAETHRLPWRLPVGASFLVMAAAAWATPFTRSVWPLAAVFLGLGLCRGTTYPVLMAEVLRAAPAASTATAMGFFQAVYAVGMFAGPAVAGVVAQRAGLVAVFPFCGALSLAGAAWSAVAASGAGHGLGRQEGGLP